MEHDPPTNISDELAALAAETSGDDPPAPERCKATAAELIRLASTIEIQNRHERVAPGAEVDGVASEAEAKMKEIGIAHIQKLVCDIELVSGHTANRAFRLLAAGLRQLESAGRVIRLGFGYYCTPEHFEQYGDELRDELLAILDTDREYEEYQLYKLLFGERLDDAPNNSKNAQLVLTIRKLTTDNGPIQRRKIKRDKKRITLYSLAPKRELPKDDDDETTDTPTTIINGTEVVIGGGPPIIDLPASQPTFGRGVKLPGRVSDLNHKTIRKGNQHA